MTNALDRLASRLESVAQDVPLVQRFGTVTAAGPLGLEIAGLSDRLHVGSLVDVRSQGRCHRGEVMRVNRRSASVKLYDGEAMVSLGDTVVVAAQLVVYPDDSWQGRVIDGFGQPVDGGGPLRRGSAPARLQAPPPMALRRQLVETPLVSGVTAIDVFTPLCLGQRVGIFAGSGVGKSTLLGMLARGGSFDCIVVALVGERGREVREFTETILGAALGRSVVVVATGDESPMKRQLAPLTATAIAEHFRDRGQHVLLVMDSVTRYAQACRDVALAAGEPPVARGFPPSVFSQLPRLLERAGPGADGTGTITGIYTVLIDGDDHNDPVADAIRGILDGHIVLERAIAAQGRYPAIDLLTSVSRLAHLAWTAEQRVAATGLRSLTARFEDTRDLRAMGGMVKGADAELDRAIDLVPKLYGCLSQSLDDPQDRDPFRSVSAALSGG